MAKKTLKDKQDDLIKIIGPFGFVGTTDTKYVYHEDLLQRFPVEGFNVREFIALAYKLGRDDGTELAKRAIQKTLKEL